MFRTALLAISIFWLMDLMDYDFMKPFDTTYPLNFAFWLGVWIMMIAFTNIDIGKTEG